MSGAEKLKITREQVEEFRRYYELHLRWASGPDRLSGEEERDLDSFLVKYGSFDLVKFLLDYIDQLEPNLSNVTNIGSITKLDLQADQVLRGALGKLEGVVLAGYTHDGEHWFASSYADGGNVLWLIENLKKKLLSVGDELS